MWLGTDQSFSLGDCSSMAGLELNFWMLPKRSSDILTQVPIMKFLGYIELDYQLYMSPQSVLSNSLIMSYAGMTYNISYPLPATYQWMNINIRVQYATYIITGIWVGPYNLNIAPDYYAIHPNPTAFTTYTLDLETMTGSINMNLAEIRVLQLDPQQSWGQYFKYHHGIWPSPSIYESQVQYYTAYNNILYIDINLAVNQILAPDAVVFPVERCGYGQYLSVPTVTGLALPTQTYMNIMQCNFCTQQDCLLCPANAGGTCKLCANIKGTQCQADTVKSVCPFNYYALDGLCMKCPPGCLGCTLPNQCLGCAPGLAQYTNLTASICKCVDGQYGVADLVTNQLNCMACNTTACQFCQDSPNYCTQCSTAKGLYLYNNTCVSNCSTQLQPSYTNTTDQKCYSCGPYCNNCVNGTYCKAKQCTWSLTGGMQTYNHNGKCMTYCPDASIPNSMNQTCDDCIKNCAVCVGQTNNCTVCNLNWFVSNALCVSQCPPGNYPDATNVCKVCPSQCVLCHAASQCTVCTNKGPTDIMNSFYYVNYQCVLTCPARYFPDSSNPWNLFCRSCPSMCNNCNNENTCTICDIGWYMDYFFNNTQSLCVQKCQPGRYPSNSTLTCQKCLTDCEVCDNSTTCFQCVKGKVLQVVGSTTTCVDQCPQGQFPDPQNVCQNCVTGCQSCTNNYTCNLCSTGFYLLQGSQICVATTCPVGYFMSGGNCLQCQPQCQTCSTAKTCDSCIVGYDYSSGSCNYLCGNGIREDNEECDDGNVISGDGCNLNCQVESGYQCMPTNVNSTGPDVCYCDSQFQTAGWTSYWGTMQINFASNIVYYPVNGPMSSDAGAFCSQILDPSMLLNNLLGTTYQCFLISSANQSSIVINVDLDSTIGNNAMNYQTVVTFIFGALRVEGCPTSIPLTYQLTNLPLDSPIVYFQSSHSSVMVPQCALFWGLNIFTSKGFTKRDVSVTWQIQTISPENDNLLSTLQQYLNNNYLNVKYFEFSQDQIESLAGTSMVIKVMVTNFLGMNGTNQTTVTFSNKKSMYLIDLQDIYTFQTNVDNSLTPRVRIPYCSTDNSSMQTSDLTYVTLQCTLYSADLTISTPLTNCTILAFNMTLGNSYSVKVQALNLKNPNFGVTKWVHIDTAAPLSAISYIQGCNRLFSVSQDFVLSAQILTNETFASFNWYCTDQATGSPCFTQTYSYITMTNTQQVTIAAGQLFANATYIFQVVVLDALSQTQTSQTCFMYAAPSFYSVMDMSINSESNKNGFIDFNAEMAAFKVQLNDVTNVNTKNLTFAWKLIDSSGTVFSQSQLSIYQNSMGVLISLLARGNVYQVQVNATDGFSYGYINMQYQTEPSMSFELSVEPLVGEPLNTIFTFSVTSQDTLDGLYQYVFGYINPVDGISQIPIYQKSTNSYQRTQLPYSSTQTFLTCYAQVMLPSGKSKTYLQNVTLSFPSITVDQFKTRLSSAVMDNLIESMQIKNTLIALQSRMTLGDTSQAIQKVLKGLQKEHTPLSDFYIQSSVASLFEYISKQTAPLLSDPNIITTAGNLFQQMTIGENKYTTKGMYSQFGRAATQSLYNFANNIFQLDFTSVIGGSQQLIMKAMFMQGLKNVLKGSLSNSILGDAGGGFQYQGQNVYVKAIKFDLLEQNYHINASLPKSLLNTMAQNFVNMSLPNPSTGSNPCQKSEACQASIIILDSPSVTFISNSKDAKLMSIYVDLSLQATQLSTPNSLINIADISVTNLQTPIKMTIPLRTAFTDTSGNTTLGCGYLDNVDNIFKEDGVGIQMINRKLVTCQPSHLTSIGCQQYAVDQQSLVTANTIIVTSNTTTNNLVLNQQTQAINMWGSWAVYNAFIMLGLLIAGIVWGYQRDKRDELQLKKILLTKEKLYCNLYLDPLPDEELAKIEDDENDYEAIQEEKQRRIEEKKHRIEEKAEKYRQAKIDSATPVQGLFSPEEMLQKFGMDVGGLVAKKAAEEAEQLKKTKKKKKKTVVQSDMFFEGGDELPEYNDFVAYEGGDGEDDGLDKGDEDEGAETVKSKGKKKKKKKKSKTLKSIDTKQLDDKSVKETTDTVVGGAGFGGAPSEVNHNLDTQLLQRPDTTLMFEDIDGKSVKSKKKLSKKKKKTLKPKELKDDLVPEEQIQFNDEGLAEFKQAQEENVASSPAAKQVPEEAAAHIKKTEPLPQEQTENAAEVNQLGGKKGKKGSRSSKVRRQQSFQQDEVVEDNAAIDDDDQNNYLKPDVEAEEYSPNRKKQFLPSYIDREELFKPIRDEGANGGLLNQDLDYSPAIGDDEGKSTKTKRKKGKKKKVSKKKKQADAEEVTDDEDEQEDIQGRERDDDEEAAGCCHFCFWNFREGHRFLSFFSYFNTQMNRPVRWAVLIMSWYLFMAFSGFFIKAPNYIGDKSSRIEQLICGIMAAIFMRPWILAVTYMLMHQRPSKVYEIIANKVKANREIRNNNLRFYIGLVIVAITIVFGAAEAFNLSATLNTGLVSYWFWAFLFAVIADFVLVDGIFIIVVTLITVNVGVAPDTCGRHRDLLIKLIPPAIKDSVE